MLSVFCMFGATVFAQDTNIEGGGGIIMVDGNPNLNADLNTVTPNEGNVAYDRTNEILYFYNADGTNNYVAGSNTPGDKWIAVDVSDINDPITSVVSGSTQISVATSNGQATVTFNAGESLSYDASNNTLTFTHTDGTTTSVVPLGDLTSTVSGGEGITVTETGTGPYNYEVEITGLAGATSGQVLTSDGSGGITWETVVDGVSMNSSGQLVITTSDGATTTVAMDGPRVGNYTDLTTAVDALANGASGIAIADQNNTFGLPAFDDTTNNREVGVMFFIRNTTP